MDGDKANLVVTDPPYNVAYESADGKKIQNDSMADGQFYEFLLAAFRNMAAHMAEGLSLIHISPGADDLRRAGGDGFQSAYGAGRFSAGGRRGQRDEEHHRRHRQGCLLYTSSSGCYHARNRYLVDHADSVLALYNGSPTGGTAYTVKYACQRNKEIIVIDPATMERRVIPPRLRCE